MKFEIWEGFSTDLRIVFPLTILYFRLGFVLRHNWGVKASKRIYRMAGFKPTGFFRLADGDLTILAGISKITVACSLFLALICPAVAQAYSYDEIVQMVRAEEKVFGEADYSKSLDQRLQALEQKVFGMQKTGSDSVRLKRVCRSLGLLNDEEPKIAAPYSVVITPPKKLFTNQTVQPILDRVETADAHQVAAIQKQSPGGQFLGVPASSRQTPQRSFQKPKLEQRNPHHLQKTKKTDIASLPPVKPIADQLAVSQPAPAEPQASSQIAAPNNASNSQAMGFGAILIAMLVGIVSICTGMVIYLLVKVKSEVSQPFVDEFDEELEVENSELAAFQPEPAGYSAQAPQIIPVEQAAPDWLFAQAIDAATVEADPALSTDDTIHVNEFALEWSNALHDEPFFAPAEVQGNQEHSFVMPVLKEPQMPERNVTLGNIIKPAAQDELSALMASMSPEEVDELLEEFVRKEMGDPTDDFQYLCDFECDQNANEYSDNLVDFPSLASLNLTDMMAEETSANTDDTYIAGDWPVYESPIAPRISTVDTWKINQESLESFADEIEMSHANSQSSADEMEIDLQSFESREESLPEIHVTALPAEIMTLSNDSTDDYCSSEEWGGESYRALAQLLIEAAKQARTTTDNEPALPSPIPVHRKRAFAARTTGSHRSAEFENQLRALFST